MAFGEIYKYTWWGKVITGGFGAIYQALISLVGTLLSALNNRAENYENNTATDAILVPLENSGLLEKASIILTPTAYGDGVINAIEPQNGDGDFDFVRATTATRVNALGLIEEVAAGIPRIDYSSGVGQWLFEPARTNILTYSEDFTIWSNADVSFESGYTAPDGSTNAYKITKTGANANVVLGGVSSNDSRTIYARTVSGTGTIQLLSHNTNINNFFTVTEQWQRFELNSTPQVSANFYAVDFRNANSTLTEVILWGAQSEVGSYATSYIPTNGTTITRNADIANNSGNADLFNDSEGVLYAEIAALADANNLRILSINDGTTANRVSIQYSSVSKRVTGTLISSAATIAAINYNFPTLTSYLSLSKIAFKYKTNDFALWINGIEIGTLTSGATFTSGVLNMVDFNNGGQPNEFYGKTKELMYFPEALTDLDLETVTSWSSFELMKSDLNYV